MADRRSQACAGLDLAGHHGHPHSYGCIYQHLGCGESRWLWPCPAGDAVGYTCSGRKPMSKALRGQGNTLWIAIVVSTVLVALVVLAATKVRLPRPVDLKTPKSATSEVAIIRADSTSGNTALLLQVELYDPRPLFLPTPINNSDPSLPPVMRREPGSAFKTIPPKPIFVEYEKLNIALPDPVAVPGT